MTNKFKQPTELQPHIYEALTKKVLRTRIAQLTGLSEQSIRNWALKKDIQLLRYDIICSLANYYETDIKSLLIFKDSN
jgi:hypothetical protein